MTYASFDTFLIQIDRLRYEQFWALYFMLFTHLLNGIRTKADRLSLFNENGIVSDGRIVEKISQPGLFFVPHVRPENRP